jgi:hypothetical protein
MEAWSDGEAGLLSFLCRPPPPPAGQVVVASTCHPQHVGLLESKCRRLDRVRHHVDSGGDHADDHRVPRQVEELQDHVVATAHE